MSDTLSNNILVSYLISYEICGLPLCIKCSDNKSQGQMVSHVGIDLRVPCFSHGQLYVGCSMSGHIWDQVHLQCPGAHRAPMGLLEGHSRGQIPAEGLCRK